MQTHNKDDYTDYVYSEITRQKHKQNFKGKKKTASHNVSQKIPLCAEYLP